MNRSASPRSYTKRRQQRHERLKRTIFYNLRQGRKRTATPRVANRRVNEVSTNPLWESIVLHYLNKLKSSWKSKPKPAKDIFDESSCGRNTGRSSASNSLFAFGTNSYNMAKKKALNIVKNAVEYGQAKGIISKNGKFFWFENPNAKLPQKLAPVLTNFCDDCKECRKLMKLQKQDSNLTKRLSPALSSTVYSTKSTAQSRRVYCNSKDKHPKPMKKQTKKRIEKHVRYQCKYNKRNKYEL